MNAAGMSARSDLHDELSSRCVCSGSLLCVPSLLFSKCVISNTQDSLQLQTIEHRVHASGAISLRCRDCATDYWRSTTGPQHSQRVVGDQRQRFRLPLAP